MRPHPMAFATAALAVACVSIGCAATDAGPVAGYDGSWSLSKRGVLDLQPGTLTRAALQEASAHCAASGKRFRQLDLKESPPGLLSAHAESELKFACD